MAAHSAKARWDGSLQEGGGTLAAGSGAFEGAYSFQSRFGEGETGTTPEELIAAAEAACFTMQLSGVLGRAGHEPERLETDAKANLRRDDSGARIESIVLSVRGRVPGVDQATFEQAAQEAKDGCIISRALAGVGEIQLEATLEG
jgi:osmotically inducible protein OsmC